MQGRKRFSRDEAEEIRRLLREKQAADRTSQKSIRQRIRDVGFYISDWGKDEGGFTAAAFDELVTNGSIEIDSGPVSLPEGIDYSALFDDTPDAQA